MPRLTSINAVRDPFQRMFVSAQQVNQLAASILGARRAFLAAGDTASALRMAEIYKTFNDRLNNVAKEAAGLSEVRARTHLDATQKRPDSHRGPLKLRDTIKSEWAKGSPSLAYVGVGVIEELDKAINPNSGSRETYWRAQEFGFAYSHIPEGFFFGPGYVGASAPSPSQAGVHPLFVPSAKGRKFLNPPTIAARHFMRDASAEAVRFWTGGVEAASLAAAADMRKLIRLRRVP